MNTSVNMGLFISSHEYTSQSGLFITLTMFHITKLKVINTAIL